MWAVNINPDPIANFGPKLKRELINSIDWDIKNDICTPPSGMKRTCGAQPVNVEADLC